ncbi:MAG: hypothetical protein K2Q26_03925 [Bdellovibrionales bacterium]|nr:hypothetical protein [Bdellovibrionales bacterium]
MNDKSLSLKISPKLSQIIKSILPNAAIKIRVAAGGFLVEIIDSAITDAEKINFQKIILQAVHNYNADTNTPREDMIVFHRLFLYPISGDQFKTHGTLHTKPAEYDDDGAQTTFLEANDAYVWLAEVDVECLLHGGIVEGGLRAVSESTNSGFFMINEGLASSYKQLETEGGLYAIKSVKLSSQGSNIWLISLHEFYH